VDPTPTPAPPAPLGRLADTLLAPYAAPGEPGASLGVFRDGAPLCLRAAGAAVLEPYRAATERTAYRLASLSKQFTATAVLLLVEAGRLTLDTRVAELLPELGAGYADVRLEQLLAHTSGIPDYEPLVPDGDARPLRDADVLALLAGRRDAYFPAGTAFRYSNSGYALLALVVERTAGMRYADFLRELVFAPLGMRSTRAYEPERGELAERAYGHATGADGWRRHDGSVTSAVLGDGGVYGCIGDLGLWERELCEPALLPRALVDRLGTPAVLGDGTAVAYGCGWYVDADRGLARTTHHGETAGHAHVVVRYPGERLGVWVLTNRAAEPPWRIAQQLADQALGLRGAPEPWPFHVSG
jgi:CubicO group peptidase (beta-lactamase class C family)